MRMQLSPRGGRRFPVLAALLAMLVVTSNVAAQNGRPGQVFDFALTGDQLYGAEGIANYPALAASIDAANVEFMVFGGDFKNGSTLCDDATFDDRLRRFMASAHPLVFLPGDNEWTDCHRANNGSYDPLERLDRLRRMFYPVGRSLGRQTMALTNQSSVPGYEKFVENVRWTYGDVMFVGLNIQGSNNNLGRTAEMDLEYAERNAANLAWLHAGFDLARANGNIAIMLLFQANPMFPLNQDDIDRTLGLRDTGPSGFADFHRALEEETLSFGGRPVVLAHGDTHYFRIDQPMLNSANGRRVENFTRVEWYGSADFWGWVRVRVDPSDPNVFSFRQELVRENFVNHAR